jgi:acyl carrier protein
MSESIEQVVEAYIRERFHVRADDALFSRDVNMWENGYVDSAGVVEMIAFLERTFNITLPEEVLFDPDFTNIRGISRLVYREQQALAIPQAG